MGSPDFREQGKDSERTFGNLPKSCSVLSPVRSARFHNLSLQELFFDSLGLQESLSVKSLGQVPSHLQSIPDLQQARTSLLS